MTKPKIQPKTPKPPKPPLSVERLGMLDDLALTRKEIQEARK